MASSIRDIAAKTGLSIATVSLALRGGGRISAATRKKVLAAAKALDYKAHPLLSKAFSLARQPDTSRYRETLGFIIEYETETGPDYQKKIHGAAEQQARRMGYKLEPFLLSGKPSEHHQLNRILQARGIRGLIIIPRLATRQPRLHLEWARFASVEIGRTLWSPRNLHHIETADYHKVIEAIHILKKAGYHRIGMAVEPMQNQHQRGIYYAASLVMQLRLPEHQRIPPLSSHGAWSEKTFRRWMKQYKPDVLFIHEKLAGRFYSWLKSMRLRVPQDISLFCSNVEDSNFSGLRRDYEGMGRSAVEMLSLLLESGDIGIADNPRCWQIDEFWQAGTTLQHAITDHIHIHDLQGEVLGRV
jgi:DNA-binding LacI/PurR family transcriptional regulator